jgi:hypothetical protein
MHVCMPMGKNSHAFEAKLEGVKTYLFFADCDVFVGYDG